MKGLENIDKRLLKLLEILEERNLLRYRTSGRGMIFLRTTNGRRIEVILKEPEVANTPFILQFQILSAKNGGKNIYMEIPQYCLDVDKQEKYLLPLIELTLEGM